MKPHSRKLLPDPDAPGNTLSPPATNSPDPLLQPINGSTRATPFRPNSPIDSSMALTALVLLTALFFMGFFSLYLRRFDNDNSSSVSRRRRRRRPPSPYSSSLPLWRSSNYPKGLDLSTVRSLPLVSYGGVAKLPIDCVICLCEFEDGETVKMIPYCGHVFHPECIDTWLASHVSCPLCRSSRIIGGGKVCLLGEFNHGASESSVRSTVEIVETWAEEGFEVGPAGMMRRSCSFPNLGDRVELRRSLSF